MNSAGVVLVVEDEKQIREAVAASLEYEGLSVLQAGTVRHAAVLAAEKKPNLIVLDLGLPDGNGIDFIRDYRAWSSTPILILSARTEESSKVEALDAGADDYLTKPFGVAELLARTRALMRRYQVRQQAPEAFLRFGDFTVDCVQRIVKRGDVQLHLTQIEYRLLVSMAANPDRVLTHRQLLAQVWGNQAVENHQYLRVYVGHLRQKIEDNPAQPRHILTELGVGYRFEP